MLDAYTSTLYEIPFEIARRAQEGALTPDEAARLESVLADRPRLSSPGAPSSPAPLGSLRLIVTNRCNFACRYCFADGGSYGLPPTDMAEAVAVRAVDHFFARHPVIREISFFGGEPLLNMGAIRAACRRVRELGKAETTEFSMVTNASLISEEVACELQDLGISIVASVDGPASVHDRQRVFPGGRAPTPLTASYEA